MTPVVANKIQAEVGQSQLKTADHNDIKQQYDGH